MSMFDYLDTRALSEPTEIDMSDVDETEEVEITTEGESVSETEEQEELLTDEDIVEVSEQIEVEKPESSADRKTAEQLADSWDEGVFEYQGYHLKPLEYYRKDWKEKNW